MWQKLTQEESKGSGKPNGVWSNERCRTLRLHSTQQKSLWTPRKQLQHLDRKS